MDAEKRRYLIRQACEIRRLTLQCIGSIGVGHVGGSLSIAELLSVLYFDKLHIRPEEPQWRERDRVVLSKGHAGPALYSALSLRGYFDKELLTTLNQPGTSLPSHCDMRRTPGIDMTTGSLGQGASSAVGLALSQKLDGCTARTYVIFGDGEMQEGQIWEALLFASHHHLDNLTVMVDYNRLQIDGTTDEICSLENLGDKLRAFGFAVEEADGHDPASIGDAIDRTVSASGSEKRPCAVILHTVKGYGVSAFEGQRTSHSASVTEELLVECLREIDEREKEALR